MHKLAVMAFWLSSVAAAGAQAGSVATPQGTQVAPARALDSALSQFEKEFTDAARAMPADKYGFSPASLNLPGAKYDGVKTFAQEVTHVAQANYSIYSGVLGARPDVDVKAIGSLTGKEAILKALAGSFAFAHKAIATVTMANENDSVPRMEGASKFSLAAYGPAHGFDHYGQIVEYLRMNGIVPPASAK